MADRLLYKFVRQILFEDSYFKQKYGETFVKLEREAFAEFSDVPDSPLALVDADTVIPGMPESAPIEPNYPSSPRRADKGVPIRSEPVAPIVPSPIVSETIVRRTPASESPSEMMDTSVPVSDPEPSFSSSSSSEDDYQVVGKGKKRKGKSSKATQAKKPAAANVSAPSPATSRAPSPAPLATAHTSRPTANKPAANSTAKPPANPAAKPAARKPKPAPPIFLQEKAKWTEVSKACVDLKIRYTSATSTQQGIKIKVPTSDDFRALSRLLVGRNYAFHTFSLPEEKPTRVVIRNIPKEIPSEDVLNDLINQKIPATAVHRLQKARGGEKYDMVLVICDPVEGHHPIFKVKSVCSLSGVVIERPFKSYQIGQCHRCQMYGHSQNHCYAPHRCVKCLGDHGTSDCPRPKDTSQATEPPSCVLCGQSGHPANYRGCPKAPKSSSSKLAKRASARQQRESPSVKIPSSQLPERLSPQRPSPWNSLNHQRAFPALGKAETINIPGLLDTPVPAPAHPAPRAAAPQTAQNVTPVASPAPPRPSPPGPVLNAKETSLQTIVGFVAFVGPEADCLAEELRNAPLDPLVIGEIFSRYPEIETALVALKKKHNG